MGSDRLTSSTSCSDLSSGSARTPDHYSSLKDSKALSMRMIPEKWVISIAWPVHAGASDTLTGLPE